jgi:hypothetical protein
MFGVVPREASEGGRKQLWSKCEFSSLGSSKNNEQVFQFIPARGMNCNCLIIIKQLQHFKCKRMNERGSRLKVLEKDVTIKNTTST